MTDYISSFLDNIKQKTTNPLLGTIIFVILIRYWDIFYALFTFDSDCDMLFKQTYIHNYFAEKSFLKEIFIITLESFVILISTYVLLTLSRLILNIYQKHLIARTDKLTDKNSIKTLVEYQALEKRLAEIFEQLRKVNQDNNELELRIGAYKNDISERATTISELTIEKNGKDKIISDLENKIETYNNKESNKDKLISDFETEIKDLKESSELLNHFYKKENEKVENLTSENEYLKEKYNEIKALESISEDEKSNIDIDKIILELYENYVQKDFIHIYNTIQEPNINEKFFNYKIVSYLTNLKLLSIPLKPITTLDNSILADKVTVTELGKEIYKHLKTI